MCPYVLLARRGDWRLYACEMNRAVCPRRHVVACTCSCLCSWYGRQSTTMQRVWYVAYGSNLWLARFLCYLAGGTVPGRKGAQRGARDRHPPQAERAVFLPHQLRFCGASRRWGGGGVAAVGSQPDQAAATLARAWLITREQFEDLAAQENAVERLELPWDDLPAAGALRRLGDGLPYGSLLGCAPLDGLPALSLTGMDELPLAAPSAGYLRALAAGLRQTYALNKQGLRRYLEACPGIVGRIAGPAINAAWREAGDLLVDAVETSDPEAN